MKLTVRFLMRNKTQGQIAELVKFLSDLYCETKKECPDFVVDVEAVED